MKRIQVSRLTRTAILAAAIMAMLLLALVIQAVRAVGVFNSFPEQFAGSCKIITGMKGPEDI